MYLGHGRHDEPGHEHARRRCSMRAWDRWRVGTFAEPDVLAYIGARGVSVWINRRILASARAVQEATGDGL
jgi:hypothetical protein